MKVTTITSLLFFARNSGSNQCPGAGAVLLGVHKKRSQSLQDSG